MRYRPAIIGGFGFFGSYLGKRVLQRAWCIGEGALGFQEGFRTCGMFSCPAASGLIFWHQDFLKQGLKTLSFSSCTVGCGAEDAALRALRTMAVINIFMLSTLMAGFNLDRNLEDLWEAVSHLR